MCLTYTAKKSENDLLGVKLWNIHGYKIPKYLLYADHENAHRSTTDHYCLQMMVRMDASLNISTDPSMIIGRKC